MYITAASMLPGGIWVVGFPHAVNIRVEGCLSITQSHWKVVEIGIWWIVKIKDGMVFDGKV